MEGLDHNLQAKSRLGPLSLSPIPVEATGETEELWKDHSAAKTIDFNSLACSKTSVIKANQLIKFSPLRPTIYLIHLSSLLMGTVISSILTMISITYLFMQVLSLFVKEFVTEADFSWICVGLFMPGSNCSKPHCQFCNSPELLYISTPSVRDYNVRELF